MTKKKCIYCGTKTKKYKSLKVKYKQELIGCHFIMISQKKSTIYCCLKCFSYEFENWYYEPDVDDYWWC